jgi:hypothetical protein
MPSATSAHVSAICRFKGEPGLKHRAVVGPNLNCHSTRTSAIARAAARMLPDGIPRQISYRDACFFRS